MATELLPQHLAMAIPDLDSMKARSEMDPDVSATLSDFLTYTEHLPSSLVRSLTLIQTLNRKADKLQLHIHDLLGIYARLPTITADAPDSAQLRHDISLAHDKLEKCKRMSAAEAARLEDLVVKDSARLQVVRRKLKTLPMPPSRDPTPEPILNSPQLRRNAQAAEKHRAPQHRTGSAPRVRSRKIMVPGEVLPPPNPDSPPPSDWSGSPSPPPASPGEHKMRQITASRPPKTPKLPKESKETKERPQKPARIRVPGTGGTNAHSAVAGISTSNALMALTAPPPDAAPGSKWLPWKRLTEYELATLRKRMKKNAIWVPSPAMRNRELKNLGRGYGAMEEAKQLADATGQPFIDDYDPSTWVDPTRVHMSGEEQAETNAMLGPEHPDADQDQDAALINRGMRLNQAKKLKREKQKLEDAQRQQQDNKPLQSPEKEKEKEKDKEKTKEKERTKGKEKDMDTDKVLETEKEKVQPAADKQAKAQEELPAKKVANEPNQTPAAPLEPAQDAKVVPESKSRKPSKSKPEPEVEVAQPQQNIESNPVAKPATRAATPAAPKKSALEDTAGLDTASAPAPASITDPIPATAAAPTEPATTRKRKRDATTPPTVKMPTESTFESPDVLSLPRPGPQPKKLKLSAPSQPAPEKPTITISTRAAAAAANAPSSPAKANTPVAPEQLRASTRPQRSRKSSVQPQPEALATPAQPTTQAPTTTTRSTRSGPIITLRHSKAASAEPSRRASLRRGSNASLPGAAQANPSPAPSNGSAAPDSKPVRNRKKRPAPGIVTAEGDGNIKVSIGKRKSNPKKGRKDGNKKDDVVTTPVVDDEMVDPDEARYCHCDQVSFGTMLACDNSACPIEWFHAECVGVDDIPPRRSKWYCPDCRKKLKVGLTTNGIVRV